MGTRTTESTDCASGLRKKDLRNARITNVWCVAWALTFMVATYVVKRLEPPLVLAALASAVPFVLGVAAIRSYRRFVQEADELTQRIHLEALGIGAAAAMVVGTTFIVLSPVGASTLWGLTLTLAALCLGFSFAWRERRTNSMRNRLRVLRAERRMSQADLAVLVDVSRQTINAIEVGKHDPSLTLAFRIAGVFAQPVEALFWEGDEPDRNQAAE